MTLQLDPFVVFFQEVIAFTLDILDSRVGQCSRCKIVGGAGERCPEEVPQALPENRVSLTMTRAPKQFKYQKGRNPPQPILLSEFITFVELHDLHQSFSLHPPAPHPSIWCGWATSLAASELTRRQLSRWWPTQPLAQNLWPPHQCFQLGCRPVRGKVFPNLGTP